MAYGYRKVFKSKKNIFIADIHGEGTKLSGLIKNLKKEVDLYQYNIIFLGDILGKGTEHDYTLKQIKELKDTMHQIYIIEGNWEKYILNSLKAWGVNSPKMEIAHLIKSVWQTKFLKEYLHKGFKTIGEVYSHWSKNNFFDIFENLLPYFESRWTIATHAPILNNMVNAYIDLENPRGLLDELYEIKTIQEDFIRNENEVVHYLQKKLLICGHQPNHFSGNIDKPIGKLRKRPTKTNNRIFLDCGGAGTTFNIPIFAYIENLDLFICSN